MISTDLLLSQQIERVHATLIEEVMGSNVDNIVLVSAQSVDWADSSLGCPQPGMVYAQVITQGYKIVLRVGDIEYQFHTDANLDGQILLCTKQSSAF